MTPRVSIITPTYNRAHHLTNAIASVVTQTSDDWEMLIVDDGSTDHTVEVVKAFADARIAYIPIGHSGVATARNVGLNQAEGTWITYVDSDDTLLPKSIETISRALEEADGTLALGRSVRIQELYDGERLIASNDTSEDMPADFVIKDIFSRRAHLGVCALMHHRRVIDDGLRFDTELGAVEDWDFIMSIATAYPDGFVFVPEYVYDYRQRFGVNSLVANAAYTDWARYFDYIFRKHEHDPLMEGQTWHPERVEKWLRIQKEFDDGEAPPPHLYYFPEIWKSTGP